MGAVIFRIVSSPIRVFIWMLRMFRVLFLTAIGKTTGKTVRKSSGSFVASTHHDPPPQQPSTTNDPATQPDQPTAIVHNLFFRKLTRPRLIERTGADLSLEEARREVQQAARFFTFNFSLFPRGDFFYEEVEQDFLHQALGKDHNARDARFIDIMTQFRRILNDNSRRLFLYYTPLIFSLTMLIIFGLSATAPLFSVPAYLTIPGIAPSISYLLLVCGATLLLGLLGLTLLYQWPYKVTQQKNLLGLDNYVTSKFARVNQNFLVAKRRSLNIERNKRMSQAEELREEAGIWTLAYQWFGLRLFFCETLVRNKAYQIRRNTTLYNVGGVALCFGLSSLLLILCQLLPGASLARSLPLAASGLVFITLAYALIMGRAVRDTINVLHANEWSRFYQMELHRSIADHVAEDKLQIVTFRDRNRFE